MMAKNRLVSSSFVFCYFLIFLCVSKSWGAPVPSDNPKIIAIQHRDFHLSDELSIYGSYMPLDSFTTYFNATAGFTHYFSDFLAWEVVNAGYANSFSTGIREFILNTYNLVAPGYDTINYYFTTNVLYTPMYMKNLVFNNAIGYGDISFVFGGGITKYEGLGNVNTVDLGVVLRYFLNKNWSAKLDVRNYFFLSADLKNNLSIGLGIGYNFGGGGGNTSGDSEE